MQLDELLKNVAVIGAAGKMGRGIALLLLQEMARSQAEKYGSMGGNNYQLKLIDSDEKGLIDLRKYLREQLLKYAEKNINTLRSYYVKNLKLISNEEIIGDFVEGALDIVEQDLNPGDAASAQLVFEAIVEDLEVKASVLSSIAQKQQHQAYFFTNTSSIPIHVLKNKAKLNQHLVGFHFYNPPPIQKLIELVLPDGKDSSLNDICTQLTKRLNKVAVRSADIAGFIGNGYFMREAIFACHLARELADKHSLMEGITLVNSVTQDFLVRPMGIFQLMDYVGIDVCQRICQMMKTNLKDDYFYDELIHKMVEMGHVGGQHSDGSQRDGFFHYDGTQIKGVFNLNSQQYDPLPAIHDLGGLPPGHHSWKSFQREKEMEAKLNTYLHTLFQETSQGACLAQKFLINLRSIAQNLVRDGVARTIEDVNKVLKLGFYHLYGVYDAKI